MGELFAEHFVAAHQQVGDFRVVDVNGRLVKNGGNVASYFCTPEGRVVHAVVGPASAEKLLAEAQWALDVRDEASRHPVRQHAAYVALAHYHAWGGVDSPSFGGSWGRPVSRGSREKRLHELFARRPLPLLAEVYDEVFEDVLGQRLSDGTPVLAAAERGLILAERTGRPVLFVLHNERNNGRFFQEWSRRPRSYQSQAAAIPALLQNYVTIVMPLEDLPALSQFLGQKPFQAPTGDTPLFVISDAYGRQRDVAAGWSAGDVLAPKLARGLVESLKENPPPLSQLRRSIRFLEKFDKQLARELIEVVPGSRATPVVRFSGTRQEEKPRAYPGEGEFAINPTSRWSANGSLSTWNP